MSLHGVRRGLARMLATAVLTSTAGALVTMVAPQAALAESSYTMESEFIAKMNAARESNGLRPYAVASDLTSVARSHSQRMAASQTLYHNPNLTTDVKNWQAVGENVGEGPTVSDIHTAFMNSPEHRANILDHDFTQVGVGVTVDKNGIIWVTEDFREPMHTTTTRTTTNPTTTATRHATSSAPATFYSGATTSSSAPAQPATVHPSVSPRALLLRRLQHVRSTAPPVRPVDPVAQAFDYVSTVARIAG